MKTTSLKLTDKEIQALAKKLEQAKNKKLAYANSLKAKAKIPEAKKIIQTLNTLPDAILSELYDTRYQNGRLSVNRVSELLLGDEIERQVKSHELEADVILAAHGCTTMSALCKKLDI